MDFIGCHFGTANLKAGAIAPAFKMISKNWFRLPRFGYLPALHDRSLPLRPRLHRRQPP